MANKEKNFISVVIYVHNTEKQIEDFLKIIIQVLEQYFEHSEIICVNDFSQDASVDKIKQAGRFAKTTNISVLNMSYFHGLEMAMNAGVDLSIGDFVFEFDNTKMDYSSDEIMKVYWKSLEGYDIVSASPDKKERFTSRLFYKVFERFSDFDCKMNTERFRILSRRVINRISSMNKMVPYRKAIYVNCGLKTTMVKYSCKQTESSDITDKKERKYRIKMAEDALILFTEVGYRFSVSMTLFMMMAAIFMMVYSLFIYFGSSPVPGWTTTILFLSLGFFGLFGILTIIVKYLQLLIDLEFKRKRYTFESIEKLTK